MSDEKKLTPFEQAKENLKKTAENFNFYNSIEMLMYAIEGLEKVEGEDKEALETMFLNVIQDLSHFLEERDKLWN